MVCLGPGSGTAAPRNRELANENKAAFVHQLLRAVPSLAPLAEVSKGKSPAEFNEFFMGERGKSIVRDVASPALWSVKGLEQKFRSSPTVFFDLCKVKWAFNIKPDLVLLRPGATPICIEAKLESGEGAYPGGEDAKIVDAVMGKVTRQSQFQLQQFLFSTLLGSPCRQVVVQKLAGDMDGVTVFSWGQVFERINVEHPAALSIPFVKRLISENVALRQSVSASELDPLHPLR